MYPNIFASPFSQSIYGARYKHPEDTNWTGTTRRVMTSVVGELFKAPNAQPNKRYIHELQGRLSDLMGYRFFIPGGRYMYSAGRDLHQVNNCLLLRVADSREGWGDLKKKAALALMTGAGIGVWYGDVRPAGSPVSRTEGTAGGPVGLCESINADGHCYISGGNRRSAIWAGLPWNHKDIFQFIESKDWSDEIRACREKALKNVKGYENFVAPNDFTNISVTLDDEFFDAYEDFYHPEHRRAVLVFETALAHMLAHGEPGFSVDRGKHAHEVCRNACTEITSADDSDVCNLGHLVLPRFDSPAAFGAAVRDAVMFLTAGSLYSDVPYKQVAEVRDKNRRLGLGVMGVHEFVMKHGAKFGTDGAEEVLEPYALQYAKALEWANEGQDKLGLSPSVGATAIAPNGTTAPLGETSASNDPIFAMAERRTVIEADNTGDRRTEHIVIDPTAARLLSEGIPASQIEDAYTLSREPQRRLRQQAFMQKYTDHAISSTVNIEAPITDPQKVKDFGDDLMKYLPDLRGITVYPDGAVAGQPRNAVSLEWAMEQPGVRLEAEEALCSGGVCAV